MDLSVWSTIRCWDAILVEKGIPMICSFGVPVRGMVPDRLDIRELFNCHVSFNQNLRVSNHSFVVRYVSWSVSGGCLTFHLFLLFALSVHVIATIQHFSSPNYNHHLHQTITSRSIITYIYTHYNLTAPNKHTHLQPDSVPPFSSPTVGMLSPLPPFPTMG